MSLEERARDAARRAQGAVQMIEVPESETVVNRRRARHRTRAAMLSGVVALGVVVGTVAIAPAIGSNSKHPTVAVHPKSALEFRAVERVMPCSGGPFENAQGPGPLPAGTVTMKSRDGKMCYVLGNPLLSVSRFNNIEVAQDQNNTQNWNLVITFDNDDFTTKVAQPEVGKQVAMVVDGVVLSAPTINPGISGRNVQVTGAFTKDDAQAIAAKLLGVNAVTAKPAPTRPTGAASFAINGCPEPCNQPGHQATAADVVSATARNDAKAGWVVDVKLTPAAAARFAHDTMELGVLNGQPVSVAHVGDTFTLSSTQTVWDQATATQVANSIRG